MRQKRIVLSRLRDARGRLRDIEAARTAQAIERREETERGLVAANRDLVSAVVRACDQIAQARRIADLEAVHDELGSMREQVKEAREQVKVAEEARRVAAERLSRRERELRTTERALDLVTTAERREGDRREQLMVDDLVGARVAQRER